MTLSTKAVGRIQKTILTTSTFVTPAIPSRIVHRCGSAYMSSLPPKRNFSVSYRAKLLRSHLKPGGYVEVQEFQYVAACDDDSCDRPYAWRDFLTYLEAGLAALGSELNGIQAVEEELLAVGFGDLRYQDLKCPVGPWPKKLRLQECGHMLRDVIMWGLVGLARRPFRDGLGWTNVQIEMFLVNVRKDLSREGANGLPAFHSYFPFRSIFGRKPLNAK